MENISTTFIGKNYFDNFFFFKPHAARGVTTLPPTPQISKDVPNVTSHFTVRKIVRKKIGKRESTSKTVLVNILTIVLRMYSIF